MEKLVSPTKPVEGGEKGEDKEVKKDEEKSFMFFKLNMRYEIISSKYVLTIITSDKFCYTLNFPYHN